MRTVFRTATSGWKRYERLGPQAVTYSPYPRIASLKTPTAFRSHLVSNGIPLDFDDELVRDESPLAQPIEAGGVRVGNRFCVLPMEGWDGTTAGEPSELTRRRWRNFGMSGEIGRASCRERV